MGVILNTKHIMMREEKPSLTGPPLVTRFFALGWMDDDYYYDYINQLTNLIDPLLLR